MEDKISTKLKRLIYFSKPTIFDYKTRKNILEISRENNSKTGLTGSLIYRSDIYLQLLEGPTEAVNNTYIRIKLDTRHSNIHKIYEDMTNQRLFPSWAMREDTVRTWMWSREDVRKGLISQIKPSEALKIFERLSQGADKFFHTGEHSNPSQ